MDSFEWNKIFGAVLGTVLFVASVNILINGLMAPPKADKPGMEVAVAEESQGGGTATPEVETKPDWGTLIPAADVAAGEKVHVRCQQCHDFSKGGPNKIGPNLWGIIGGKHAHMAGFPYSPAFTALKDKDWGYDEFNAFMKSPKAAIPGTKMSFAGLSKEADRVNLIAYMRTLSDAPLAVPAPNPAAPPAAEGEAAPAEGAAPTEGTAPAAAPGDAAAPAAKPAKPAGGH